ncbi:hypothetical protein HMPREF9120_00486 [Neisseria sp. oral taxon 020 str. F0370]|nr:hypothetical protein HMPREF9120_00486 [Neisseria sp. oral taxon 020 str. F0370]
MNPTSARSGFQTAFQAAWQRPSENKTAVIPAQAGIFCGLRQTAEKNAITQAEKRFPPARE